MEVSNEFGLAGQAGVAQAQQRQRTGNLDKGPTHRHLGRTCRAAQEAVMRQDTVCTGLRLDEVGRLGWDHITASCVRSVEGLHLTCSGESLGGFKQEMEIDILISIIRKFCDSMEVDRSAKEIDARRCDRI